MKKILFVFSIALICLIISSCRKTTEVPITARQNAIIKYLVSCGINEDRIEITDGVMTIDGDVGIDEEAAIEIMQQIDDLSTITNSVQERQRGVDTRLKAVTSANVVNIKYFIHPSVSNCQNGASWISAIGTAVSNWNNLSNCRVNFTQVSSQNLANLTFASDEPSNTFLAQSLINLQSPVVARTQFPAPSLGLICKNISIRRTATTTTRVNVIMHEIGHALGYFHTDSSDGIVLHGTPATDNNSIMYSNTTSSTSFTTGDKRANRLFYPDFIFMPGGFNATKSASSTLKVTFTKPTTDYPIYWIRLNRCNAVTGDSIASYTAKCDTNVIYFTNMPTGTYKFKIRGENYRQDVVSDYTVFKTVTF